MKKILAVVLILAMSVSAYVWDPSYGAYPVRPVVSPVVEYPYEPSPRILTDGYVDNSVSARWRGPVVEYPASTNNLVSPIMSLPAPTQSSGCVLQVTADITSPDFLRQASSQCSLNNVLGSRCYYECMRNAQTWWSSSRFKIEPVKDCKLVDAQTIEDAKGSRFCRSLMLECVALNSGVSRLSSCTSRCKQDVYTKCDSPRLQGSLYVPREKQWEQYLRSEYPYKPLGLRHN